MLIYIYYANRPLYMYCTGPRPDLVLPRLRPTQHRPTQTSYRPIVLHVHQTSSYRPIPDIVLLRHRPTVPPIVIVPKQRSSYRPTMMWNRPIVLPKTTFFVGSRSSYRPTLIVHPYRPIVLPPSSYRPISENISSYRPIAGKPYRPIVLSTTYIVFAIASQSDFTEFGPQSGSISIG